MTGPEAIRPAGRAGALIATLGLAPHPEGGYYREIHRSTAQVEPADGRRLRAGLTTIYFLLAAGAWQAAQASGQYTLVSCSVGPGFDFTDFALLRDDPAAVERVRTVRPELLGLV